MRLEALRIVKGGFIHWDAIFATIPHNMDFLNSWKLLAHPQGKIKEALQIIAC
tara:strand:+ start:261 stop:419 length:159 start_codon:yes stop_codon:yes gene_type:complete